MKIYTIAIISNLPNIIKKLMIIFDAGSISSVITLADKPPVVISPTPSKNAFSRLASVIDVKWNAVNIAIIGNNKRMISVDVIYFLFSVERVFLVLKRIAFLIFFKTKNL